MGYDRYKEWLRDLTDSRLDDEVQANAKNTLSAETERAADAWRRMYNLALGERRKRETA